MIPSTRPDVEQPEQGITAERVIELATDAERPILEILMHGGPIKTNRGMLKAAQEIIARASPVPATGDAARKAAERATPLQDWLEEANKVKGMFPDFGWPDRLSFSEAVAEQLVQMMRLPVQPAALHYRIAPMDEMPEQVKCEVLDCNEPQNCFHYCTEHHQSICRPAAASTEAQEAIPTPSEAKEIVDALGDDLDVFEFEYEALIARIEAYAQGRYAKGIKDSIKLAERILESLPPGNTPITAKAREISTIPVEGVIDGLRALLNAEGVENQEVKDA